MLFLKGNHKPNSVYAAIYLAWLLPDMSLRPTLNLGRAVLLSVDYLVLHQMGFTMPSNFTIQCGELLPHHFTLTLQQGGILSVALSIASRRPGVTRHPALWCSDFPHRYTNISAAAWFPLLFTMLSYILPRFFQFPWQTLHPVFL